MKPIIKTGLDLLFSEKKETLKNRNVGLCCNPTSVNADYRHAVDLFHDDPEISLVALFGPEHGIRAEAQDMIDVGDVQKDPQTGVPIYSLYGKSEDSLKPKPHMFEGIDLLIFDIQDIGSRYYTYIYTMSYLMEAAGEAGIELWVLDRPNPLGGLIVEGPSIEEGYHSFVGRFSIPVRHGLTAGELAKWFQSECGIQCQLSVIPMKGWKRGFWMEDTHVPWILPSPNMPTMETAVVYPGGCLYEGTNLSEGRGTTKPFELVGAPYLCPETLARELNEYNLPGVFFRPIRFSPTFHKWKFENCGGIQFHVLDRNTFRPFATGVAFLQACYKHAPGDFQWRTEPYEFVSDRLAIDLLCGSPSIRLAIEADTPFPHIEASWQDQQTLFSKQRKPYFLYQE